MVPIKPTFYPLLPRCAHQKYSPLKIIPQRHVDARLQGGTRIHTPGIITPKEISEQIDPYTSSIPHDKRIPKILHLRMENRRMLDLDEVYRVVGIVRIAPFPGHSHIKESH